jgi:hypothetical protein
VEENTMDLAQKLDIASGRGLGVNCGKYPSDINCKLVMLAPENQRSDLLDAAVAHTLKTHKEKTTDELRTKLSKVLETIQI